MLVIASRAVLTKWVPQVFSLPHRSFTYGYDSLGNNTSRQARVWADKSKGSLLPTDVVAFNLPDPEPEDRDRYWEFRKK